MKNGPVTVYDKEGNLIRGRPLDMPRQYIQGYMEFYKLRFKVTPDVLIPRPETELLVDEILRSPLVTHNSSPVTILDIGTGSGCIAISLAKNLPKSKVFAIDISNPALKIAEENTQKNKVAKQILFLESDLLSVIPAKAGIHTNNSVDIIVANLPYIPSARINILEPSVKDFEPILALNGGYDGFDLYRRLFQQINEKFQPVIQRPPAEESLPNGRKKFSNELSDSSLIAQNDKSGLKLIVCEIDESQEQIAKDEAQKYFPDAQIEIKADLAKKPRILLIRF